MGVLRRCGGYHLHERTGCRRLGFKASDAIVVKNVKTIAITIDEKTLELLDELTASSPRVRNRSALVCAAIREFARRARRRALEAREERILKKHRRRLARQAAALIAEQAPVSRGRLTGNLR